MTERSRTRAHDVVSKEWAPEPKRQHEQVAGEAGKQLPEARGTSAEVGEGSCHQHAMRMEAQDVVVPGIQVSRLHQLGKEKRSYCNCMLISVSK